MLALATPELRPQCIHMRYVLSGKTLIVGAAYIALECGGFLSGLLRTHTATAI